MFETTDVEALGRGDQPDGDAACVAAAIAAVGRIRGRLDALEARLIRRAEQLAAEGVGEGAVGVLRTGQRVSQRQVDRVTERATTLSSAPVFEAALAGGEVSAEHVDALTRAAAALPDDRRGLLFARADELVAEAARVPADRFERHCRQLARRLDVDEGEALLERQKRRSSLRRWTDRASGMWCLHAELDPESGAVVSAALDAAVDRLVQTEGVPRDDRVAAAGLVALAEGGGGGVRAELLLVADVETWRWGLGDDSISETSTGVALPPETIRRLGCDADAHTVVLDDDGLPLSVGRSRRTATRAQRRALRAMYPTCGFGDCDRPFDRCEIHHIEPWLAGGATDLGNLLPLCVRHHHLVHEGGWRLGLTADRTLIVSGVDGAVISRHRLPSQPTARARADEHAETSRHLRERIADLLERAPP